MLDITELFISGKQYYFLAPYLFIILFSVMYKSTIANHFFLNFSRFLYTTILGFCLLKLLGPPKMPPENFYHGLVVVVFSLGLLFFIEKKQRYLVQTLYLNGLLYLLFKNQIQANLLFIVSVCGVINVLFLLLYGVSTGKKPIALKVIHALCLLGLCFWAYKLNQTFILYVAIVCASSIVSVALLKLVFLGGLVPNFSRQLIDTGIPLILLWLLINISGVFYEYVSPYINVDVFYN